MLVDLVDSIKKSSSVKQRIFRVLLIVAWTVLSWIIGAVLGVLIMRLVYAATPVGLLAPGSPVNTLVLSALVYSLTLIIAIGVPWVLWDKKTTLKELGLQGLPTWLDLILPIGGFVIYAISAPILLSIAAYFIKSLDLNQQQTIGFTTLSGPIEYMMAFFALVILAPFVEEIIFRGYLFSKLRETKIPLWTVFLIVSVIFGAAHLQWNIAINVFVMSLVMCGMRTYTGSIWSSIILHAMKNGLAFWLLFVNHGILSTIGS